MTKFKSDLLINLLLSLQIFLFINPTNGFAKIKILSNKLPLEFVTLLETLDKESLTPENRKEFVKIVKKIDLLLENIPREYVLLLSKAEIYKYVLEFQFHQAVSYQYFTSENVSKAKDKLSEKAMDYSPFLWWVLSALITDMEQLLDNSSFKSHSQIPNFEVENKLKLLTPWLSQINIMSPRELQLTLDAHLINILTRLEIYLRSLSLTTKFKISTSGKGNNIIFEGKKSAKAKMKNIKGLNKTDSEVEMIDDLLKESENRGQTPKNSEKEGKSQWSPAGDSQ